MCFLAVRRGCQALRRGTNTLHCTVCPRLTLASGAVGPPRAEFQSVRFKPTISDGGCVVYTSIWPLVRVETGKRMVLRAETLPRHSWLKLRDELALLRVWQRSVESYSNVEATGGLKLRLSDFQCTFEVNFLFVSRAP